MDYSSLKVTELKALLKERGIPPTGLKLKAEIVDRLIQDDAEKKGDAESADVQDAGVNEEQQPAVVEEARPVPMETETKLPTDDVLPDAKPLPIESKDVIGATVAEEQPPAQSTELASEEVMAAQATSTTEDKNAQEIPTAEESRKRKGLPESPLSPALKKARHDDDEDSSKLQGADEPEPVKDLIMDDAPDNNALTTANAIRDNNLTEDALTSEDREAPKSVHPATSALYISNLVRPINITALEDHLRHLAQADVKRVHINTLRTHAFALIDTTEAAIRIRNKLHNSKWPDEPDRKPLDVDFLPEQKCQEFIDTELDAANIDRNRRWQVEYDPPTGGADVTVRLVDVSAPNASIPPPSAPRGPAADRYIRDDEPTAVTSRNGDAEGAEGAEPTATKVLTSKNASFKALDECFKFTTAKPKLYWLPVKEELVERRKAELKNKTSRDWDPRADYERYGRSMGGSGLDQLRRFTFEDGDVVVDGGAEFGGIGGGRGGRGGGGGRGGRYGGRGGRGGDRWR